ncbi:MAG: ribosomal protein S18-alanine N-acetyltransferase [Chloroflexaceae bacterium]|nr:ribosomal protein S18-alanine N-acetyltransferase [Chloroflexaceae bacterium]
MTEKDIKPVQAIERLSFDVHWSDEMYRRELRQPQVNRYLVARFSPTFPAPRGSPPLPTVRRKPFAVPLLDRLLGGGAPEPSPSSPSPAPDPMVGYAGIAVAVDEGHITTVAVHPSYRRRGIGELLLNGLIDLAVEMHAAMLTLEVRVSNLAAQNLYLKYGFVPTAQRPRYYDNGEDALIMWTEPLQSPAYQTRLGSLREQLFSRLRAQAEDQTTEPASLTTPVSP